MSMNRTPHRDDMVAAIERRLRQARLDAPGTLYIDFDADHPRRQEFRRMIDPGILRPNSREVALKALETMKTLAENILSHPNETKYHRFKPTNNKIQQYLMNPKGPIIEYLRKMGFEPEVDEDEWQPYYVFDKQRIADLKMGLTMINEAIERELPKKEREERALKEAKAAEEAAKEKALQKFMDDRKSVRARVSREATTSRTSAGSATLPKKMSPANIKTLADLEGNRRSIDDGTAGTDGTATT